jgi:hypothetical protein
MHPDSFQGFGNGDLFMRTEIHTGSLFSVPKCGIRNQDSSGTPRVLHHRLCSG